MEQNSNNIVDIHYLQTGKSTATDATLRNAMKELPDETFNDALLAIDEFHHTSADANSNLGDVVRRVMNNSTGHIVAMTGSYFRGDGIPVLRAEDETKFFPITYNYYQQLNGYKYLKNLVLGYHFYHGSYHSGKQPYVVEEEFEQVLLLVQQQGNSRLLDIVCGNSYACIPEPQETVLVFAESCFFVLFFENKSFVFRIQFRGY